MDSIQLTLIDQWFEDACFGACEAFQLAPMANNTDITEFEMLSIIGFAGGKIRGTLGIAASREVLLAALRATGEHSGSDQMMLDCLGEIANQSLGRLKNGLLRRGVEVAITTPMVLRGLRICVEGTHQAVFLRRDFSTPYGNVCTWLDTRIDEDLVFLDEQVENSTAEEGDMLFF